VEWLADELRMMGLTNISIKKFLADGKKKYFLWPSLVGWKVKEAELWQIKPERKLIARFSDQAVSLMPYSQGRNIEAEVVYVGGGKRVSDYKGKDVKDKIVFAIGGGGSQVHREAVINRKAAGVVVGPSGREDRLQFSDLIELNRLSYSGEEKEKVGFGFSLSKRQEIELLSIFDAGQKVVMKASVDAEIIKGDMPVLEAVIPGKEFPSQEIIIMGHLDHYKPGANDNASGSAGMMEMVQNIISMVEKGTIPPLKRTLRFLWLPEMHGTIAYLTENMDLKERGIAGLNLDMIGENYTLCQSVFGIAKSPYSVPGYINDILMNLLGWLDSRDFFSPRGSKNIFNFRTRPFSGGSDHIMFNDSSLSIPTPMLGHSDVFHHTNMDTPDKCDPTEMKRIISLALAASLFLANADNEEAMSLAQEVSSQAVLRVAEKTNKSILMLQQNASNPEKQGNLSELYSNFIQYPRVQIQLEKENIREVSELCTEKKYKSIIEEIAENLDYHTQQEQQRIRSAYELILNQYKLQERQPATTEASETAASLVPKRLFQGPLTRNFLREKISPQDFRWYSSNMDLAGGNADSKMYEIVNLMNGKRSLLDIRHIISCEYDETSLEFVVHFAQDLEKAGLAQFVSAGAWPNLPEK
jgi:hypothetical protein